MFPHITITSLPNGNYSGSNTSISLLSHTLLSKSASVTFIILSIFGPPLKSVDDQRKFSRNETQKGGKPQEKFHLRNLPITSSSVLLTKTHFFPPLFFISSSSLQTSTDFPLTLLSQVALLSIALFRICLLPSLKSDFKNSDALDRVEWRKKIWGTLRPMLA